MEEETNMPLPKAKTKPKTDLGQFSMLIYGPTKFGKTTFASKFKDAVFLATEPGTNSLEVFVDQVKSWTEFTANCKELAAGKHNFKTIVVDTVDNLYKYCSEEVCSKLNIKHESELGFGKGFSMVNNEFLRVLTRLAQLPYGLVLISHSQEKELDTRTGKIKKMVPTLPEAARKIVCGLVDIILFGENEVIKDETTGKSIGLRRVWRTKTHPYYEAGDRTGRLPDTIDLDYEKFIDAFNSKEKHGDNQ